MVQAAEVDCSNRPKHKQPILHYVLMSDWTGVCVLVCVCPWVHIMGFFEGEIKQTLIEIEIVRVGLSESLHI